MTLVEIRCEAAAIGIRCMQLAIFKPQGVGRAQFFRKFVGPIGELEGCFLIRDGDVATDEAAGTILQG